MRNFFITMLTAAILVAGAMQSANAYTSALQTHIGDFKRVGNAQLKVMLWRVFDARLYSATGQYDENAPFALSLTYLRSLDGEQIVDKSIEEILDQAPQTDSNVISDWRNQLAAIIPDVSKDTTITGIRTVEGYTRFYEGETALGSINDPDFTRAFFDIWLGEKSSNPTLRSNLINMADAV